MLFIYLFIVYFHLHCSTKISAPNIPNPSNPPKNPNTNQLSTLFPFPHHQAPASQISLHTTTTTPAAAATSSPNAEHITPIHPTPIRNQPPQPPKPSPRRQCRPTPHLGDCFDPHLVRSLLTSGNCENRNRSEVKSDCHLFWMAGRQAGKGAGGLNFQAVFFRGGFMIFS